MWVIRSLEENALIWDTDGEAFEFDNKRDAELVARVLTEYCFEKCEVLELPDDAANAA